MMDFHRGFITQERAGTGGSAPPVEIKSLQALVTEELGKKLENMGFTLQRIKNRQVIWNFRLLYGNIWEYMGIYIYIQTYGISTHHNYLCRIGKFGDGTSGGYIHQLHGDWCWCLPPRWHCNAL